MERLDLKPVSGLDLETVLTLAEHKAVQTEDGHLTLMRFGTGWKAMLGTPDMDFSDGREQVMNLRPFPDAKTAIVSLLEGASNPSEASEANLRDQVWNLLDMLHLVFNDDWELTRLHLMAENYGLFIEEEEGGTFFDPKIGDESNNWANRGSLLSSIREVAQRIGWEPHYYFDEQTDSSDEGDE